jgi:pyruvate/2-oxoglutarate dehydrogenase complex dihydrolipoamide dehydrogenase (E3) component
MDYDFLVLGGGSAGYAGARTAAALGLKTAVVEGGSEIGGLCILRGCMPSKTLLESAKRFRTIQRAAEFGLACDNPRFDPRAIVERKRRLIQEFADYRRSQLEDGRFDFIRGHAEFISENEILVDGSQRLSARSFLVATGSRITFPPVPGLAEAGCLTSDNMLDLEKLPASLIVLGAGAVGLELASYCRAFGCRVTVVQRNTQLLSGTDPDVAGELETALRADGIDIHTGTSLVRVERNTVIFLKSGKEHCIEAEAVLNALGRSPSLGVLGKSGVEIANGRIAVDDCQATSVPHIFAAGDVCGPLEVVHTAIQQGEAAASNAALLLGKRGGGPATVEHRLKLFAVFTEPQLAVVGASEAELRAQGREFVAASYPFNDHGKSMVMGEQHGFVKLIGCKTTGEILGGAVVGPEASDLIHEVVVAMHHRTTAREFASIPHYHPTLSEIWTYPAEEIAEAVSAMELPQSQS